ncbi:hypothetical protein ANCCAN_11576 [Ancylostoma caninum]|uniref:Uncharacterized protein n=1 Tax=Ancylostoma caninum TaxID=29170 RepID=A0A368GHT0_ANCCA|nr:hypothetical protein ANCCAN_11576 [Ancylostoma caninum]
MGENGVGMGSIEDQSRYGMRQRSASECGDWDGIVLKSILKKPQRIDRFSRSKSESHHSAGDASQLSLLMESTTEISESDGHTDNGKFWSFIFIFVR